MLRFTRPLRPWWDIQYFCLDFCSEGTSLGTSTIRQSSVNEMRTSANRPWKRPFAYRKAVKVSTFESVHTDWPDADIIVGEGRVELVTHFLRVFYFPLIISIWFDRKKKKRRSQVKKGRQERKKERKKLWKIGGQAQHSNRTRGKFIGGCIYDPRPLDTVIKLGAAILLLF